MIITIGVIMSLLMPKATAVWLIDNTTLTFEQISEFCDLHVLEVQAIADGDVGHGILGFDPILNGSPFLRASRAFDFVPPKGASTMSKSASKPSFINPEFNP